MSRRKAPDTTSGSSKVTCSAALHPELHDPRIAHVTGRVGHARRLMGSLVDQPQGAAGQPPEVHQQIEVLGGRHGQGGQFRAEVHRQTSAAVDRSTAGTVNGAAYGRSSPGVRFFSSVAPVILSTAFSMISVP